MSRLPKAIASFNVIRTHIPAASTAIGKRIRKLAWTHRRPRCLSEAEEAASGRRRAPDRSQVRAPGTRTVRRLLNTRATVQRSGKPGSEPARRTPPSRKLPHGNGPRETPPDGRENAKTTGRHPLALGMIARRREATMLARMRRTGASRAAVGTGTGAAALETGTEARQDVQLEIP